MKRTRWLSVIAVVLSFFAMAVALASDFSADIASTSKEGAFKGKIFVTHYKVRIENPQSVIITRIDKNIAWALTPKKKMYTEQPFDFRNAIAASEKIGGETERTLIGPEKIGGSIASKYKIVYGPKRETMFQWVDDRSNIPIKSAAEDSSWSVEYSNLKIGPQADSLFEIPADYEKLSDKNTYAEKMSTVDKNPPAEKVPAAKKNPFMENIFPVNKATPAEKIPQGLKGDQEVLED